MWNGGSVRNAHRFLALELRERNCLGDPGEDGMMILKWIFIKRIIRDILDVMCSC
jgi:tRNA1(Val) A37 N6-methylase TrmN6